MTSTDPSPIQVNVHYPAGRGSIVLRCDQDWDADIGSAEVSEDGRTHSFVVDTADPFVYYKAVLREDGEDKWSCGPNRLGTSGAEEPFDCFPFFEPSGAQLTDLFSVSRGQKVWDVRVVLPPGYDENERHRYPVLYMNDGHNLFLPQESATGTDWDVAATLDKLDEMTSVEQVIVVGIYARDRSEDYGRVGGEEYAQFLAETLVPTIDERFRTLDGPTHRAILGSSLGGVSALSTAWARPDVFGMAGCLSATFGYDDSLKTTVLQSDRPDIRVYIDSGWPRDNFEVSRDMRARLLRAGFEEGRDLLYFAFPGARHSETDWGDRVHIPFQYFFGERPDQRSRAAGAVGLDGALR